MWHSRENSSHSLLSRKGSNEAFGTVLTICESFPGTSEPEKAYSKYVASQRAIFLIWREQIGQVWNSDTEPPYHDVTMKVLTCSI